MRPFKSIFRWKDRGLSEKAGEESCQLIRCVKDSLVMECPKDGNGRIFRERNGPLRRFYCWNALAPEYGKWAYVIEIQWQIFLYPCWELKNGERSEKGMQRNDSCIPQYAKCQNDKSGPGFRCPGLWGRNRYSDQPIIHLPHCPDFLTRWTKPQVTVSSRRVHTINFSMVWTGRCSISM